MTDHTLTHEFNELAEEVSLTDVDGELCHIEEEGEEEHGHEDEMHAGGCSCTQTVNVVVETILSDRVIVVNYTLHNVHYTQTATQLLTLKNPTTCILLFLDYRQTFYIHSFLLVNIIN